MKDFLREASTATPHPDNRYRPEVLIVYLRLK